MRADPVARPGREQTSDREARLLAIIREHVDTFDPARVDETLAPYSDDVCLIEEPDFKPDPRTYRGRERCRAYWKTWVRMWEASDWTAEEFRVAGERVAVAYRYWARGRRSQVEVRGRIGMLYTFAPGTELIVRQQLFGDPGAALAAVDA